MSRSSLWRKRIGRAWVSVTASRSAMTSSYVTMESCQFQPSSEPMLALEPCGGQVSFSSWILHSLSFQTWTWSACYFTAFYIPSLVLVQHLRFLVNASNLQWVGLNSFPMAWHHLLSCLPNGGFLCDPCAGASLNASSAMLHRLRRLPPLRAALTWTVGSDSCDAHGNMHNLWLQHLQCQ